MTDKFGIPAALCHVRELGLTDGMEHLVLCDAEGRWKREAIGTAMAVSITLPDGQRDVQPGDIIVHSHPIERGLSVADLMVALQNEATVYATTPSGCVYRASTPFPVPGSLFGLSIHLTGDVVTQRLERKRLSEEEVNRVGFHMLCLGLQELGFLTYKAELSIDVQELVERALI